MRKTLSSNQHFCYFVFRSTAHVRVYPTVICFLLSLILPYCFFFFTLLIIPVTFMNDVAQRPCSYHVFHLIFTNTTFRKPVFICRVFFSCYRKETRNQTYTRETYKKHVLNGSSALNIKLNPDSLTVRWIIYCRLPFWKN